MTTRTLLDTVPVKLTRDGQVRSRHRVEVLTYHVRGWASTRCLDHGLEEVTTYRGDPRQTAVWAAKACARRNRMPFGSSTIQRLEPTPAPQGGG